MTDEELIAAIEKYFGDTSRSVEDTRTGLLDAYEHIGILLEAL